MPPRQKAAALNSTAMIYMRPPQYSRTKCYFDTRARPRQAISSRSTALHRGADPLHQTALRQIRLWRIRAQRTPDDRLGRAWSVLCPGQGSAAPGGRHGQARRRAAAGLGRSYSNMVGAIEAMSSAAIVQLNGRVTRGSLSSRLSEAPNSAQAPLQGIAIKAQSEAVKSTLRL